MRAEFPSHGREAASAVRQADSGRVDVDWGRTINMKKVVRTDRRCRECGRLIYGGQRKAVPCKCEGELTWRAYFKCTDCPEECVMVAEESEEPDDKGV